jgi:hypothetical protein
VHRRGISRISRQFIHRNAKWMYWTSFVRRCSCRDAAARGSILLHKDPFIAKRNNGDYPHILHYTPSSFVVRSSSCLILRWMPGWALV